MSELPKGWCLATLEKVSTQPEQVIPAQDSYFTYVDIASIDREKKAISSPQTLLGSEAPSRARKLISKGDVLVSMTRPNLNAVALTGEVHQGFIASTGFDVLRPIDVDPRWIYYIVRSSEFVEAMASKVQGALYPAVKIADIRSHEFPLPPLAEQARIAQALDGLLAQVDTLKARLDALPALIKRFRQSVLSAAVSGSLTGSDVTKWRSLKASDVCSKVQSGGTPKKGFYESGVPFLKVYNIVNDRIDFDYKPQFASLDSQKGEISKSVTYPGDVLMNIVGPPLGKIAIVPDDHPEWNINQAITLFRPSKEILSKWIAISLMGGEALKKVILETRGIAGQVRRPPVFE